MAERIEQYLDDPTALPAHIAQSSEPKACPPEPGSPAAQSAAWAPAPGLDFSWSNASSQVFLDFTTTPPAVSVGKRRQNWEKNSHLASVKSFGPEQRQESVCCWKEEDGLRI